MPRATACIACGVPTLNGSRCPACNRGFRRAVRNPAYDTPEWRARRKRELEVWVREHGWVCPGFQRPRHPSRDLTLDHVLEMALGGAADGETSPLCRSCNTRKRWANVPRRRR